MQPPKRIPSGQDQDKPTAAPLRERTHPLGANVGTKQTHPPGQGLSATQYTVTLFMTPHLPRPPQHEVPDHLLGIALNMAKLESEGKDECMDECMDVFHGLAASEKHSAYSTQQCSQAAA